MLLFDHITNVFLYLLHFKKKTTRGFKFHDIRKVLTLFGVVTKGTIRHGLQLSSLANILSRNEVNSSRTTEESLRLVGIKV